MLYSWQFPLRVTRYEDGIYRWRAEIDRDFEMRSYKIAIICVGAMCLFMAGMGLVLSFRYGFDTLVWTLVPCVIIMGITLLLTWLMTRHKDKALQAYEMGDDFVRYSEVKGGYWNYKSTRELIITADYCELKKPLATIRVYYVPEDKALVSGHLMTHMPPGTPIKYQ